MIIRTFVLSAILFLFELYFIKRLTGSVKNIFPAIGNINFKPALISLLIFFNIYPVFLITVWTYSSIFGTPVIVPANAIFDYLILYPFWIYIFIALQCILFYILIDAGRLIFYPLYKKIKNKIYYYQSFPVLLIFIFFLFYVPINILYDYFNVQVRTVNYYKENLPTALNNFKIALIADIQADRYTDDQRLQRYISLVNEQSPDLVLIGGDVITSTPEYINKAAYYLGKLKSKYGVYSCVGDHDNWAYRRNYTRSLKEVTEALAQKNVKMINDRDVSINVNGALVLVTFVTNTYVEHVNKDELNMLTSNSSGYVIKILLTHQPGQIIVDKAMISKYDLLLAGHTHGGQITFLFPFINLTPTLLETRYVKGNFHFGKMLMIVNRGLGMSLVPVRYNSLPEITIINIRSGKNG